VEVRSLSQAYGTRPGNAPLPLGALKAQFGHCFAAAGMASVVKTLLALRHGELPPNRYEHPLKPALQLAERGFDPLQQARPWPRRSDRPRRAAINAFGTGGINVHLLLEEAALA
jgi:acyl transferase domain-containing protein